MNKYFLVGIITSIACFLNTDKVLAGPFNRPDFFEQGRKQFEQEIRQLQTQQSVPDSPLTVNLKSLSWLRLIFREEGFTMMMPPGAITQETEMVKTPKREIKFDLIASHPPDSRFVIAYSEQVSFDTPTETSEIFDWSRDYIMRNIDGEFTKTTEKDIVFSNYSGREFILQNQAEMIVFRLLWINQRLYVLGVSQEKQKISKENVTKFFDSFEIL